ncbi:Na-translocating system protein MpsC family protein [Neobacillus sp. SuZ13]|uniref:Na-translocating system protein MpsC family protein n=1 Tax=Neobacillus sp. SuZ13 TaxID=3047875 RepID=UPI0024C05574|nr:Na-translocating system protein MpsC family protein [Neobacillus sp. SuZ13]WHY67514.1 Na-translocating system protein MpsC family protein [Neobacillus sp. SuZ13]
MINQNKEEFISSYVSKLLRKNFGKGPHTCRTTLSKNHLVTYIRGFLTPMEEILLQQGQNRYVDDVRAAIINHVLNEITGVVKVTLEVDVEEYYHDWNFPNNSGILIFVLEETIGQVSQADIDMQRLESEVGRLSYLVEKVPDHIHIYPISPSVYLVERSGILVPIEKALIEKGFEQELRFTKDELEKKYFHREGRFEDIFKKSIRDIFIDWNFKEDKSLMAFMLGS